MQHLTNPFRQRGIVGPNLLVQERLMSISRLSKAVDDEDAIF